MRELDKRIKIFAVTKRAMEYISLFRLGSINGFRASYMYLLAYICNIILSVPTNQICEHLLAYVLFKISNNANVYLQNTKPVNLSNRLIKDKVKRSSVTYQSSSLKCYVLIN